MIVRAFSMNGATLMTRRGLAGAMALAAAGLIGPGARLRAEVPSTAPRDSEVVRTTHDHHVPQAVPSAQGVTQAPPPVTTIPQPPTLMAIPQQAVPVVQMPAPQPLVLQTQSPSIVLQQNPPTIYLAPPSQPTSFQVMTPAPMTPNVGAGTPTASPQLFLAPSGPTPSHQGVATPQPQMMMAAPAPVQPQMMMMTMTPAAQPAVAAAPVATQLEAIPPGPIGRAIGELGEKLAKHKLPRIRATTSTVINQAQVTLAPTTVATPAPVVSTPAPEMPPVAQPSEQGGHHFRHPFKWHGR